MARKSTSKKSRTSSKRRSSSSSKRRTKTGSKSRRKASNQVRTEMHHMRSGKHKVKSRKQAIAIGLSKARRKGAHIPKKSSRSKSKKS